MNGLGSFKRVANNCALPSATRRYKSPTLRNKDRRSEDVLVALSFRRLPLRSTYRVFPNPVDLVSKPTPHGGCSNSKTRITNNVTSCQIEI